MAIEEAERIAHFGLEQRTGKFLPVKMTLPTTKFVLDLCAVKFLSVQEVDDDCRICWRGRAMPKHFKGGLNEDMKDSMMKTRSSRLIKTPNGLGKMTLSRRALSQGLGQRSRSKN